MKIYESGEDYLEMILMLQKEKGYARSIDVAAALGVTKPSVSVAMKKLRENGYILMDGDNLAVPDPGGRSHRRPHLPAPHCSDPDVRGTGRFGRDGPSGRVQDRARPVRRDL